ncbi:EmrB/QacA subfamily drug resistance transporter [Nocardia transvalensis]|uniref:EmrB/QacA subfamily drug resistance transporter n=1 Tax=Nocardia transvalensis TaxID=37333 RepID=A0A7W9PFW9_9NOCA|nr:MFS transporter [Nocardia transvalensis]MBB5915397.1 EmrB/QacA subfamily drug resistance transporter [Nocardia transvalensis]
MTTTVTAVPRRLRWVVAVSSLAVALVVASMAALYTALPEIAADTGATQSQLTWVIDGYTLALACLVLPAGALGDRYGRRLMLIGGLTVFALASAAPLVVDGPVWLIVARSVAGAGAAAVMPSTLSILTSGLPEDRRSVAIGIWAGTVGGGAVLGILGSGLLMARWSWISIMLAMTIAGVVLAVAAYTIPESSDSSRPPFDPWGAVSGATAIGLVTVAVLEAPQRGWTDPAVLVMALAGVAAGAVFVVLERRATHPLLDVRLFAERGFSVGTISVAVQFLVSFGLFMLIVQFFQLILGYRPLMSALAMAPMIVPMIALSLVAPWLAQRFGLRLITTSGLAIVGAGVLSLAHLTAGSTFVDVLWPLLIMSVGLGLSAAPATAAIVEGVPADKHGVAAAVNDAAREVGAAVGIALAGSILAAGYSHHIAAALPMLPEAVRDPVSSSLASALQVTEHMGPQAAPLAEFAETAFVHGLRQSCLVLGLFTIGVAIVLGFWAPGRRAAASSPTSG